MLRCSVRQVYVVSWASTDGTSCAVDFQPNIETVTDDLGHSQAFFEFGKWSSRAFARACLGKGMKHGDKEATINVEFIDSLVRKRKAACNAALAEATAVPGHENKRRRKLPVCTKKSADLLPPVLTIHCDGFEDDQGIQEPKSIKVLSKDFTTSIVWIELQTDTIDFLMRAIRHDLLASRFGRSRVTERGIL